MEMEQKAIASPLKSPEQQLKEKRAKYTACFVWSDNKEFGPFSYEDMAKMFSESEITPSTLVRTKENGAWHQLEDLFLYRLMTDPDSCVKEPLEPFLPEFSPTRPTLIAAWFCILLGLSALVYFIFGYAPPLEDAVHPRKLFVTGILVLSSIGSVLFGGLLLILDAVKESSRKSDK